MKIKELNIFYDLDIYLKNGFDNKAGLTGEYSSANNIDLKRKITTAGPHKADVIFESKDSLIKDIFSRGEQKLLIDFMVSFTKHLFRKIIQPQPNSSS